MSALSALEYARRLGALVAAFSVAIGCDGARGHAPAVDADGSISSPRRARRA